MKTPPTVIIGDHTQGLGITRSAALAGGTVWVVNDKWLSLARCSRYLSGYRRVPRGSLRQLDCPECAEAMLENLLSLPLDGQAALFGVNEDIVRFMHLHRDALRERFFIPEVKLDCIYDKFAFNKLAPSGSGLYTQLCSEMDLDSLDQAERFVLKGRSGNAFREATGRKAIPLPLLSMEERQRLFASVKPDQVILQEFVDTTRPILSVCSFAINGRLNGLFGYEKLRQHPDRFGTGTYLRSASIEGLKAAAQHILSELDYTGISEIEFIHDPRSEVYKVIEMNPRPWKSIHFATQCGQNLVARQLSMLAGSAMERSDHYAIGQHWTDLATDIPQMLRERAIPRYHGGCFECAWDRSDPWPALMLWTMFPFIAWEGRMPAKTSRDRGARKLPSVSKAPCRTCGGQTGAAQ